MTPPAATKTASVEAPCTVLAGSSGVVPPPVATTPVPRPQHIEAMCSAACQCEQCEAGEREDWKEVLPRRSLRPCRPPLLVPSSAPRPIPAWLAGRCCRCLAHGHRAAVCGGPFRCSRCLGDGHRARECRNAWRPLSLLGSPTASSPPRLAAKVHQDPTPRRAQFEGSIPSKVFPRVSWASVVSAPAGSLALLLQGDGARKELVACK
jgi:hypothetical protein